MAVTLMLSLIVAIGVLFAAPQPWGGPQMTAATLRDSRRLEGPRHRLTPTSALLTLAIIAITVIAAFPLAWMVLSSFERRGEHAGAAGLVSSALSFDAYAQVSDVVSLGRSVISSAVIAVITTIAIIITSLMAGYAFAKYEFKHREARCSRCSSAPCSCPRS